MEEISLTPGNPMRKDASCINILTCERYIKSVMPQVSSRELFDGIIGNHRFLYSNEDTGKIAPVTSEYLLQPHNWVCNGLLKNVYRNTIAILNDPQAVYKAGRNIFKTAVGSQVFLMRLAGVQTIINRLPQENAKFNRNRSIKIGQQSHYGSQ